MRSVVLLAFLTGTIACGRGTPHYTGFVEGEERVVRSEVTGRVLEVKFAEVSRSRLPERPGHAFDSMSGYVTRTTSPRRLHG